MLRRILFILLIFILFQTTASAAVPVIVQLGPLTNVNLVTQLLGGTLLDSIAGTNVHLLQMPALPQLSGLQLSLLGIISIEIDKTLPMTAVHSGILTVPAGTVPDWYRNQPAMQRIHADGALPYSRGQSVVVADINSKVDFGHPALAGHLTGGFDFVAARAGYAGSLNQSSSEFLDQSSSTFLDQSSSEFLDQSSAGFLEQSASTFLDSGNPATGHGTLCAGIIAVIAPDAAIMPLRVFDDTGHSDVFSIAKAIYYGAQHGAQVINMSLGLDRSYTAVQSAITFAQNSNVTVVASAGNANTSTMQYPAAYSDVIAVAATDLTDRKASFSNFGSWVDADAPGVNIISAYPGDYYAMVSGTSFSAPMVAAEAALIRSLRPTGVKETILERAIRIDNLNPGYGGKLGYGRIDASSAVQ